DEPTAGVDIELRENLWNLVRKLKNEGKAILLTTHYLEEAEKLCDRVAIINKGMIACEGPTEEVVKRFTQKKIILKLRSDLKEKSEYLLHQEGSAFTFWCPSNKSIGDFLKELHVPSEELLDMQIQEGTLEEAFLRVLKNQKMETLKT
ncbi:MAG TPA: ABC transporter ATP-binding protein, partial [Pseudobdellovibrionaceae bacterium]|nr:ABC transporter ATP-binding protein [Pseudobdellovibrionaceae bacterium]